MDDRFIKMRLRFSKEGLMKYIGHLDVMRYFQKAIRRAGIPIRYSEGFHPHQIMSFALPLGIGIESTGEYMDMELIRNSSTGEFMSCEAVMERLNSVMNEGITIMDVCILPDKEPNAMASVAAAGYEVSCGYRDRALDDIDLPAEIRHFYNEADSINVVKKTKKGEREVDLKPLIYRFNILEVCGDTVKYDLLLSAGSQDNIKPQLVLSAFGDHLHINEENITYHITRTDLYKESEGRLVGLI